MVGPPSPSEDPRVMPHDALLAHLPPRRALGELLAALDLLLDEGVSDYSARTSASRRRMAALLVGFERGEALARAGRNPAHPERLALEVASVLRHLLFWAGATGTEDPSVGSRRALAAVGLALAATTGSDAPRHDPELLDCEWCGERGALVAAPDHTALCVSCTRREHAARTG